MKTVSNTIIKLGIGLPAYGAKISMWHAQMWLTLGAALAQSSNRFELRMLGYVDACGVDVARNRLVADALERDCDWLLMVDADTWTDDGASLLQMISDADRYRRGPGLAAAVVAAAVPRRDPDDTRPTVYRRVPALSRDVADCTRTAFAYTPVAVSGDQLVSVDSVGAALMALNLSFFRTLPPPWFAFKWLTGDTTPFRSEDHVLCERAKDLGWEVLVDPRVDACHLQRPVVTRR